MSADATFAVTLSWNHLDNTLACLASIAHLAPAPAHTILVDNGSTDGTPQAVADRFPRVEIRVNDRNLGFAAGMNVGLQAALAAGADFVLMLNNDTLVAPNLLGVLLATAAADPRIGLVTPKIYYADPLRSAPLRSATGCRANTGCQANPPDRLWYAGAMRRRWLPGIAFPGYGRPDALRYDRVRDVDYVTGCGLLARSATLRDVGCFDSATFFMYHEDLDLSERVRRAGYRIVYQPQARMWHKESASTAPLSPEKWYYLAKYIVPFYRRYYRRPGPALALYTLWVAARETAKGHIRVIPSFLRGIRDGVRAARQDAVEAMPATGKKVG